MACHQIFDKEGKPIGFVCTRGSKAELEGMKKEMSCRIWEKCERCGSFQTCSEIIAKRKEEGRT